MAEEVSVLLLLLGAGSPFVRPTVATVFMIIAFRRTLVRQDSRGGGRRIFVHEELALKVGHFREQLVLGLQLQVLLILVSCCLSAGAPAALAGGASHALHADCRARSQ